LQSYGEPSRGGQGITILEFLIAKLRINFVMWNADPDVLVQAISLLNALGQRSALRDALLRSGNNGSKYTVCFA